MSRKVKHKHAISFRHAVDGIWYAFTSQPNFKIHLTIASMVLIAASVLQISIGRWLILLFTISWVLIAEMANTSIEALVDLITQEYDLKAKRAKDVAAGMVLISAIMSIVVGVVVFAPYISASLEH